jgi:hypothetical protein
MVAATHWYAVAGGIGAAVGGVGAAGGAIAAWRAASASRATSRDALDALAIAIAPELRIDFAVEPKSEDSDSGRWTVRIRNTSSQFAAGDVAFEARFKDGHAVSWNSERIGPKEHVEVLLREISMPPGGPTVAETGETATLRYSDFRRIWRYEQSFAFLWRKASDGSRFPVASAVPDAERQRIV